MHTVSLHLLKRSLSCCCAVATPHNFLARFLKAADSTKDKAVRLYASYLIELALTDYSLLKFSYSQIAASAVYVARRCCAFRHCLFTSPDLHFACSCRKLECDASSPPCLDGSSHCGGSYVAHAPWHGSRMSFGRVVGGHCWTLSLHAGSHRHTLRLCRAMNRGEPYPRSLQKHSGFTLEQLRPAATALAMLHHKCASWPLIPAAFNPCGCNGLIGLALDIRRQGTASLAFLPA